MSEFPLLEDTTTTLIPAEASLYSEKLGEDAKGDLWIRSFLINTKPNKRGWSVNPSTLQKNVVSAIGKPLVLYRTSRGVIDHPEWIGSRSAEANIANQEKYAVGRITRVFYDKEHDNYYVDAKVTDKQAKDYIKSFDGKKIPLPVSPQLTYNLDGVNTSKHYTNWNFTHLAIVEKGAYGPDAKVLHTCEGDGDTCHNQFQSTAVASDAAAPSENDLGFCKTQALKDASASIFDTSHVSQTDKNKTSEMPEPMVEITKDSQNPNQIKTDVVNKQAVNVPSGVESITFNYPKPEAPYFRDAPSINEQARQQVKAAQEENKKISEDPNQKKDNEQPNKGGEEGQQEQNAQSKVAEYEAKISDLEKRVKQLQKDSEQAAVEKRLAQVANAVSQNGLAQFLSEFQDDSGKYSTKKYNAKVESLASKPYSIEDIAELYAEKVSVIEPQIAKSIGAITPESAAQQMVQQAPTAVAAKASAPSETQVYKVPAQASAPEPVRHVPEFVSVPPNGKRRGVVA